MTHPKHNDIKDMLADGSTVREICKALHVSPGAVTDIRKTCGLVRVKKPKPEKPARKIPMERVIWGRVWDVIFKPFKSEMKERGLSMSGLIRHILSERYPFGPDDHLNDFEIQARCSCPDDSQIKNCNSNRDQDEVICSDCGRESGEGDDTT